MKTIHSTNLPQTFRNTVVAPIGCEENSSLTDSFETPATSLPNCFSSDSEWMGSPDSDRWLVPTTMTIVCRPRLPGLNWQHFPIKLYAAYSQEPRVKSSQHTWTSSKHNRLAPPTPSSLEPRSSFEGLHPLAVVHVRTWPLPQAIPLLHPLESELTKSLEEFEPSSTLCGLLCLPWLQCLCIRWWTSSIAWCC